ncbi:unnamed protein product [Coffea canephora]|uniref:START domain-containing protein n=1 Tax=Coffea canephora TaxID=49390 RepID=A0A068UU21_COFCA|nr:unnamed protein product [Coffea canephora]
MKYQNCASSLNTIWIWKRIVWSILKRIAMEIKIHLPWKKVTKSKTFSTHLERAENARLKVENDKLRAENVKCKEVLSRACCLTCDVAQATADVSLDDNQLRVENSKLKEKIANLTGLIARYVGNKHCADNTSALSSAIPSSSTEPQWVASLRGGQQDITQEFVLDEALFKSLARPIGIDKPKAIEVVISAMEELIRMAEIEFPLWVSTADNRSYSLNEDAYYNLFPTAIGLKPVGFKVEASKGSDVVLMNHMNLVEVFMDMNKWLAVFASIISRALVIEVLSAGSEPGNFDGTLQMMTAEYQILTPTVPTRESIFLRYCKQLGEGTWGIVDVSFDNLLCLDPLVKCRRRPSGCIIQEMPNSCSKITWVEHVHVQDEGVHYLGKPFVESGLAFGAQRWVSVLARQCERLASALVTNFSPNDINDTVLISPEGRKNILRLSERMVLRFCAGVTSSTAHAWLNLSESGNDQIRIMTKRRENDLGEPSGIVLSATTSFWLPVSHKFVFDFLRDESTRTQWDILFNCEDIIEIVHISNGNEVGNCISLLRGTNSNLGSLLMLQECGTHQTGSYIVYAPIDNGTVDLLLDGASSDHVTLLPSGFTIYPTARDAGSLLTIAFQILVNPVPNANIPATSISSISNLIEYTSHKIRAALALRGA